MSGPHICDDKDLIEFCPALDLWLKPLSKMTITVTLPALKVLDNSGKTMTISTWEVMDKLKKKVKPLRFKAIKVSKSTIEFIRFEVECESKSSLTLIESRLNKIGLKLSGFAEQLTVKTGKFKIGSTRHEWETYFRDNPHMNEMKPGLRPDTIHIESLPVKWFGGEKPKPNLLIKVFGIFGNIRRFHIPCLDIKEQDDGFKRFTFNESLSFDAFIQYKDYIGFVKAMDALRGMKIVKKLSEILNQKNNYLEYDIKVDFDKTRHLSDKAIKRRQIARQFAFSSDPAVQKLAFKSMVELKRLRAETKRQLKKLQAETAKEKGKTENGSQTREKTPDNCKQTQTNLDNIPERSVSATEPKEKTPKELEKELESKKRAEQKVKDKLLQEEVKLREILLKKRQEREQNLREILIEKRRERLRVEAKGKLKSVASVTNNCIQNNKIIVFPLLSNTFSAGSVTVIVIFDSGLSHRSSAGQNSIRSLSSQM
ncbi:unnamed protein product [Medioppia subpectinata]|uniref:A-kinase anchor protein 17A n=1 Tax=Medioppia subpectinata TaxID=1979941 RepID=A0A7R9L0P9_9ACAR|nr:unnamed protein product [Medioppia subpectinata]CAG2112996.1 unnamed protein product [Medioppia subpectinata]